MLMNSFSQSSPPFSDAVRSTAVERADQSLLSSDADLIFVHTDAGNYLSFYWRDANQWGLDPGQIVGRPMRESFSPVAFAVYLERVKTVLNEAVPEQFTYAFQVSDRYFLFHLTLSPLMVPLGQPSNVAVTGRFIRICSETDALKTCKSLPDFFTTPVPSRYHKRLTQVAWNIRRTLDLDTIWQQTVNGFGKALEACQCVICPYKPGEQHLTVVAEYRNVSCSELLSTTVDISQYLPLYQALKTLNPVVFESTDLADSQHRLFSALAVATSYQDQPNALIILHPIDRARVWTNTDLEIIQELADQVGTGIAHATLFAESRDLASELQRANESLMQKHHELEEAHKEAEEASRLKSEFLANTSHELRTPLNAMIGFLKLIMDGMADDPEEQAEFIKEAHRSAVHLLAIINDILDIARIEAGKMQLDMNPVKLDDLLTDVENFTRTQAEQKGLSYEIRMPVTLDQIILYGNYQRLLQVMLNLVSNAIKFTHQGGITITSEVIQKGALEQDTDSEPKPNKPSNMVKISVADTGIGVSLENQDKLFQSFSQVDSSRTRQFGGSGLGLVISQKLVEAMGGVVNFYSLGEGLGSTVTFTVGLYQDPVMVEAQTES
jgi:signal transduction histidine kinase